MYKTKHKKKDYFVDTKLLLSISLETMTKIFFFLINTKVPRLLLIQKEKKKNI